MAARCSWLAMSGTLLNRWTCYSRRVDRGFGRLDRADLSRLRDAVREAQRPVTAVPHREVLAVHQAAPTDVGLTVDLEAAEELGMPLLVVRVPIGPRPSPLLQALTPRELE